MYLLDTNVVSELRPGKREPSEAVRRWAAGVPIEQQYLSVLTLYEIELGVLQVERRDAAQGAGLRRWFEGLRSLFERRTVEVTAEAASRCARLQVPNRMPEVDGLIAAAALSNHFILVTRNTRDFDHRGLRLLNPWA